MAYRQIIVKETGKPRLRRLTSKQEAFAQACVTMTDSTLSDVYRTVYKPGNMTPKTLWREAVSVRENPKVASRIEELRAGIVSKVQLTRAWVLENLMDNALDCLGKRKVTITKDGEDIEVFKRDEASANRALELLGKELRMFVDRKEIGGPGAFEALDEAELNTFIDLALDEIKQLPNESDKLLIEQSKDDA